MILYRRIELINHSKEYPGGRWWDDGEYWPGSYKSGIMGIVNHEDIVDAWIYDLRGPTRHSLPWNCRFYFTELGWKKIGRKVVKACIKHNQEYRVIAIKETDAQVVWRDKYTQYEVAIQPKRKQSG